MIKSIFLSTIIVSKNYQPRVHLNEPEVLNYMELIQQGVEFPPIVVFKNAPDSFTLASGFHRFEAH